MGNYRIIFRLEQRRAEEASRKLLSEALSKGQQQRNICDQTKAGLVADNEGLSEKIESVLLAMKQEEYLVQNMKQTEKVIQTSMENVFGYMQIADWTLFNDLTRSKPHP